MKTITSIIILLLISGTMKAQRDTIEHSQYKITIARDTFPYAIRGEIFQTKDSSILFQRKVMRDEFFGKAGYHIEDLAINHITSLDAHRKGNGGRGYLIGAGCGALLGAIIGFAGGDDPPCSGWFCIRLTAEDKALMGGILGIIPGGLIGLIIGSSSTVTIQLDRNQENYKRYRKVLAEYSITNK